jgi:hypothetical protein
MSRRDMPTGTGPTWRLGVCRLYFGGGRACSRLTSPLEMGSGLAAAVGNLSATGNAKGSSGVLGVAGNFAADLDVAGSVASISVVGTVRGATWNIGGDLRSLTVRGAIDGLRMTVGGTLKSASLGTVQAAAIDVGRRVSSFTASTFIGSHLHVGFTPMNSADPMADATSASFDPAVVTRIDSFRVTAKMVNAFAGSTIAARRLGSVWLSSVRTDTLHQFGVLADESIRSVVVGTPKFRVSNRTAAVDLGMGQFRVRIV